MKGRKRFYLWLILLLAVIPLAGFNGYAAADELMELMPGGDAQESDAGFVPGEILVKFKRGVSDEKARGAVIDELGLSVLSTSPYSGTKRVRVPSGEEKGWATVLEKNPLVEYAEVNHIARVFLSPNDTYYPYQWHLDDNCSGCSNPYGGANGGGINLEGAWDITAGAGAVVAVLDTGVAYEDYVDGASRYYRAPDLANTSFVQGHDFVNGDSHPNDDHSHGTHVTGTIAQSTNNSLGVAGVAYEASIMPVKVMNQDGSGTDFNIAEGIYFAADNGAHVISMSLGSPLPSLTIEQALAYAYNRGVTTVAAAGNYGINLPVYPAAFDAYVIAVSATRFDETRSYYSNFGNYVDMAAPGGDTRVDQNRDGYVDGVLQQTFDPNTGDTSDFSYWFFQGTSMATPHVAGVAALVIANGATGPDQVRAALEATAEDKGPSGWDAEFGWGIVDAFAALNYSAATVHDVAVTAVAAPSSVLQGDTAAVDVYTGNQGDFDETFTLTLEDTTDTVTIGTETVTLASGASTTVGFTWDTTSVSYGDHLLTATASGVAEDANAVNDSASATSTVSEPSNDVAITGIDSPASADVGTTVQVNVSVTDEGTYGETTTVSLTDTTSGSPIGSQAVTLSPGETRVVAFNWDTTGLSAGGHTLTAGASVVAGETDTADNSMTAGVTLAQGDVVYVEAIAMELSGNSRKLGATAKVTAVDGSGGVLSGATVSGDWTYNGAYLNSGTGTTNRRGIAKLNSDRLRASSGDAFEFCITGVAIAGYTYTPSSNVETCDVITVP